VSLVERSVAAPRPRTNRFAARSTVLLVVFVVVAFGPIVSDVTAQPVSRYAATAAYFEHGSVDLTRYAPILGVDKASYRGELRSDKAPGEPFLAVPVYAAGRVLGLRPAAQMRVRGDLGVWWQTFWMSLVPFALLLALMHRDARRVAPRSALPATLALGVGTLALPHAVNLYGHCLAAVLAFGAWRVLDADGPDGAAGTSRARRAVLAGFLAGGAFAVEYHTAIIAAVLAAVLLRESRRRDAVRFGAGFAAPAALTGYFQQVAFGRPWRLAYPYVVPKSNGGRYGFPTPAELRDVLAGAHGLLLTSPIVLLAVVAAVLALRGDAAPVRRPAGVALAVFVPYFLLVAGWSGTPLLEQPGPRYLIPALPFLAAPLAAAWQRYRALAVALSAWGALVMIAGAVTMHIVPAGARPFDVYFHQVANGSFNPTLWSMAFGRAGAFAYVVTAVAAGALLFRHHTGVEAPA
jgi:hypothetical protein